MPLIQEYRKLKAQLVALEMRLESLKRNESLQKDIEFDIKLRALLSEHGKSAEDVIELMVPGFASTRKKAQFQKMNQRRTRTLKAYINPHSGERIETRGGNQKTLKAWKREYGSDVVESWLES